MNLAPIILFVYNRPWHTQQTLEALMLNHLADQSILYIYCDGIKKNASEEEVAKIHKVRELVKEKKWCQEVHVIEREENLGLANSVIKGVSEIIKKHERIIVLEDDIVTAKYFLNFMNKGLNLYKDEKKVFGVSGHQFQSTKKVKSPTYFLPIMSSWGYGTWLDRWQAIEFDSKKLLNTIESKNIGSQLDFGFIKYYNLLKEQVKGNIDSWAVRFQASMFLKDGVFLYPNKKLIENIGLDGSGVHCKNITKESADVITVSNKLVSLEKMPVQVDNKLVDTFKVTNRIQKKKTLKRTILKIIPPEIKAFIKRKIYKINSESGVEFEKLKLVPRYTKTSIVIDGIEIQIPDSASFLFMYDEIFKTEIYKFKTKNQSPYIIDGGANIGLASIYFKQLYPSAEIIAFEPDPEIYNILEANVKSYAFDNVKLIKKGLWNEEATLKFHSEGADAGLLETFDKSKNFNSHNISVTSLKPYLQKKVDFLKLDIEGAETIVLKNIVGDLDKVERIFVEYHSFKGEQQTLNELINILTEAKFRIYMSIPGNNSVKSPFMGLTNYNNMDFQLNIFGFKEDCN